jgi:hypothetical protein
MSANESTPIDVIPFVKSVMFVGEYFTLVTSVQLDERLRLESDADDDDFAIRLAGIWLGEYYGWDVLGASQEVTVLEDSR